jgi:hypothetical protein
VSPEQSPHRILVIANETVAGRALIETVEAHAEGKATKVVVVCPVNTSKHGNVIYEESVQESAQNRLELTLRELREAGIEAEGELGDADPYSAAMDAVEHDRFDEIIVSTHPETRSGWLRRDLIDRIRDDSGLPVEHVVVDLESEGGGTKCVLVVASQTVGGQSLLETLERLHEADLEAVGQTADPDPLTAVRNALASYSIDEIVISTFPEARSGWLRRDLVGRVRSVSDKPVEHVVVDEESGETADTADAQASA